jgi:hypothetical protein
MAVVLKNSSANSPNQVPVDQWQRVSRPAASNPQTASRAIFNVTGGRVLVKLLMAEVTTAMQAAANNTSVTFTPTGGANADIASVLDVTGDAAGTNWFVEGDGTALVATTTVKFAAVPAACAQFWIVGPGQIFWKTAASTTGAAKWDLWYTPLDPGARVVAS